MADDGLRASHEDRDRIVDVLRVAAGDGRLTAEELDQRIERALTARTYSELTALVSDLPAAQPGVTAPPKPKDVLRIDRYGANARRDGPWVVPGRIEVRVTGGNVTLDFTEAIITLPSLRISAVVAGGNLVLITRPGIVVDTDEVAVAGGSVKTRRPPAPQGPVLLRAEITGNVTGGNIIVRPPRRTFLQWLRRGRGRAEITASLSACQLADGLIGHLVAPGTFTALVRPFGWRTVPLGVHVGRAVGCACGARPGALSRCLPAGRQAPGKPGAAGAPGEPGTARPGGRHPGSPARPGSPAQPLPVLP
ncbi:MAG TPA: DUF1707 domain-containing protein [Trebonia sp.]|nr:DUF1707 domain-containing protein [Trebonia sp.]